MIQGAELALSCLPFQSVSKPIRIAAIPCVFNNSHGLESARLQKQLGLEIVISDSAFDSGPVLRIQLADQSLNHLSAVPTAAVHWLYSEIQQFEFRFAELVNGIADNP